MSQSDLSGLSVLTHLHHISSTVLLSRWLQAHPCVALGVGSLAMSDLGSAVCFSLGKCIHAVSPRLLLGLPQERTSITFMMNSLIPGS